MHTQAVRGRSVEALEAVVEALFFSVDRKRECEVCRQHFCAPNMGTGVGKKKKRPAPQYGGFRPTSLFAGATFQKVPKNAFFFTVFGIWYMYCLVYGGWV